MTVLWKRLLIAFVILATIVMVIFQKWDWLVYGMVLLCPLMHLFGHQHSTHNGSSNSHKH